MAAHKAKGEYRSRVWIEACKQKPPSHFPPEKVIIDATFYTKHARDYDNLSLKWVLDALKQKQRGSMYWRHSLYDLRGYLVDDDPAHCVLGFVEQRRDAHNPRLELTIKEAAA